MISNSSRSKTQITLYSSEIKSLTINSESLQTNDNILDCGAIGEASLITCTRSDTSFIIKILPLSKEGGMHTHEIKPYEVAVYNFPRVCIIKEQSEVFWIDISFRNAIVTKFESPVSIC